MISWREQMNGFRIQLAQAFDEYGENTTYYTTYTTTYGTYYYTYTSSDVDATTDEWGEVAAGLAVPPAIAAILMFIGTAFAINAVMTWDQIGTQAGQTIVEVRLTRKLKRSSIFIEKGDADVPTPESP